MGGLFGGSSAATSNRFTSLQVQTSSAGVPIPLLWGTARLAPNLIWYGKFTSVPDNSSGGGKGGGSSGTYKYSCAVAMALCEGPAWTIGRVWADKNDTTLAKLNLTLFLGTGDQAAMTSLYTADTSEALAYRYTAYVASPSYDLGNSANLPNHNFELQSSFHGAPNTMDANPADILVDFLTNPRYGVGMPADFIGDLTSWRTYCTAMGFFMSPLQDTQEAATDILSRWAQLTNTAIYWDGGQLQARPYGDEAVTGNGVTWDPGETVVPQYDITVDDVMPGQDDDPIKVQRSDPMDAYNVGNMEYIDRANSYQSDTASYRDLAAIDMYGERVMDTVQGHEFKDANTAALSIKLILNRQLYVRNTFVFKLTARYALLEQGDVITLTSARLKLDKTPVLITDRTDNAGDKTLSITAEEFPAGIGTATAHPSASGSTTPLNTGVDPGDVSQVVITEPSPGLSGGVQQIWIGAAGGTWWGGASVWVSLDDETYQRIGEIDGPCRVGVLADDLPATADPDTADTPRVTLATARVQLGSGNQADADGGRTLCLIGTEMVAYATATLTGTNTYRLGYVRRGLYGTSVTDHPAGTAFARLDERLFAYDLPSAYVGQRLYIKLTSFNIFQAAEYSLADVDAYTYTPVGAEGMLPAPTGLTLTLANSYQADGTVVPAISASWTPGDAGSAVDTLVRMAPLGTTDWQSVTVPAGTNTTMLTPVIQDTTYQVQVASSIAPDVRSVWAPTDPATIKVSAVLDGASVTGLELYGQGLDTVFTSTAPHFAWRGNFPSTSADFGSEAYGAGSGYVNPYFQAYGVTISRTSTGKVLRTVAVTDPEYTYPFEANVADGGPFRDLTIAVTIRDKLGGETDPVTLSVTNPVPTPIQFTVLPTTLSTLLGFTVPTDVDWAGANAWVGPTSEVDTSGTPVATGSVSPMVVAGLVPGQTYYVVSQSFDTFGSEGCPISSPIEFLVPYVTAADIAANTIGKDQLVTELVDTLGLVTGDADVVGSVAAQVKAEADARAQAILQTAQALQASINTVSQAQQGTADSLASTTTTLTAAINGNAAAIQTEQTARANGDSANASSISTLASQVNNPTSGLAASFSAINSEATTRAAADTANATTTNSLSAQVNNGTTGLAATYAGLQSEISARATGDSANATAITSLTTTVNGNTASIQTLQSSVNGMSAQYTLRTDVNGYVAGFGLANSGSTSAFVLRTDTFAMVPPNSTLVQSPFFVNSAGLVVMNNSFIQNLSANVLTGGTIGATIAYLGTLNVNQLVGGEITAANIRLKAAGRDAFIDLNSDNAGQVQIIWSDGNINRIVAGQFGDDFGMWIYNKAGGLTIAAGSLADNVVNTSNMVPNAATAPQIATSSGTLSGNGTYQTFVSCSFTLAAAASVLVVVNWQQSFSSTGPSWAGVLFVDGATVINRSGTAVLDTPTYSYATTLAAGSHSVILQWQGGDGRITASNCSLAVWASYR